MRIEVIHPSELGQADVAHWRAAQASDAALASPYFTPDWARIVGAVREDARVCVIEGGQGFLGVQRVSRFAAMGLGAPLADYQGVVALPGLTVNAAELCRALKVGRIDLAGVPETQAIMSGASAGSAGSWIAELNPAEGYHWGLKSRRGKFVKDMERKARKMAAEKGEAAFEALSTDAADFETLLAWKLEQLKRTGQPPIWGARWVRAVLGACFAANDPFFSGALFTMKVNGKLAAATLFLRTEHVMHGWVIGHDPEFEPYSPGVQLARWAIEWAEANGCREVDFGCGDYQFKRQLATGQRPLAWGSVGPRSWSGAVRAAEYGLRAKIERLPNERLAALPGKAMRRLDLMRALAA